MLRLSVFYSGSDGVGVCMIGDRFIINFVEIGNFLNY